MMEIFITAALFLILGLGVGNLQGDQATLRDCATKGKAEMVGGGVIECNVMKAIK
jgi:hypothetical protein